jgi:hypothetical protein
MWYLRNPSIGTYNVVVTISGTSIISCYVTNYAGSLSTPLRTASTNAFQSVTSSTVNPISAIGDIVIDTLYNNITTAWSVNSGNTQETVIYSKHYLSYKAGAAGTTAIGWGGASETGAHIAVAIAGS